MSHSPAADHFTARIDRFVRLAEKYRHDRLGYDIGAGDVVCRSGDRIRVSSVGVAGKSDRRDLIHPHGRFTVLPICETYKSHNEHMGSAEVIIFHFGTYDFILGVKDA